MAAKYKIKIEQGTTVRIPLRLKYNDETMDLTGYKARMQIRSSVSSSDVIHELTSENGGIDIQSNGVIGLYISAEDTANFDFKTAVYDLEIIAPSLDVVRLMEGQVTLSHEVTR